MTRTLPVPPPPTETHQPAMSSSHKTSVEALVRAGLGALFIDKTGGGEGDERFFDELVRRGREVETRLGAKRSSADVPIRYGADPIRQYAVSEAAPAATSADPAPLRLAPGLLAEVDRRIRELVGSDTDGREARMPAMIEAMMPTTVPTAPAVLQARRNSAARSALIEEFGLLTSADVAEINQSQAENRSALASRWKGEGRIFAVRHGGRDYFPGFQFAGDGKPRPVVAEVLGALGGDRGWETALWFLAANGYLDDRRPVDLLDGDPEAVAEAARHEAAETYF